MGCCSDAEEDTVVRFSRKRGCTDIFFLLLFIAALAASAIITWQAAEKGGSPYAATHGRDYSGASCGMGEFKDAKFAAWPIAPLISTQVSPSQAREYYKIKVCVKSCDATNESGNPQFLEPYESVAFWRFCVPKVIETEMIPTDLSSLQSETSSRYIGDLLLTWKVIAGSAGVAIVLALIFTKLLSFKCIRFILIWGIVIAILAACAVLSWQLIQWAKTVKTSPLDSFDRAKAARILGWVMVGVTVLLFIIILAMASRINYALKVLGSTAAALSQMRSTFFYPIVPIVFALGFVVYWVIATLYVFTVNDKFTFPLPAEFNNIPYFAALADQNFTVLKWNVKFQYCFIFLFFLLLWVVQFFVYAAYLTIAGALAQWFYAKPRSGSDRKKVRGSGEHELPWFPITFSAFRVIRYHIGTVAFASMIIAIFQFIRAVITYIQEKTKYRDNHLVRCILCCIKCCLYCLQKFIDYISRQALVVTGIKGTNFCRSAGSAFGLLASNILRVAAFNIISTFVIFLGKLFIAILTTCSAWIFMYHYVFVGEHKNDLSSPILPLVLIFILSWIIASTFMQSTYSVALECMFICYLSDPNGEFTPDKIKKTFAKIEARERERDENLQKRRMGTGTANARLNETPRSTQLSSYGSTTTSPVQNHHDPYAR